MFSGSIKPSSQKPSKPLSDLDAANSDPRLQLSLAPACHFLQTLIICNMKCCVLIDIGRTWLKFISHSLLLLQGNKGFFFFFFFFNPKNRKPSYLCDVKHETGSLLEKQHLMFPLFSTQTTGHFCITQSQYPCFGILSCQELLTADKLLCEGRCLPSQNS